MRNYETAKVALEIAIRLSGEREECQEIKAMANRSLEGVESKLRNRWDKMG